MSVRVRLAAFVAGLAVVFAATFSAGTALRPADDDGPTPGPVTTHLPGHETPTTTHAPGHDPSADDSDGGGS